MQLSKAYFQPSLGANMKIWELCIQRPIFTLMLVSVPIVLGLASYARLGVELFPNVDFPVVTVTTTLRGASVEEMETGVTKIIEEAVNQVSGIDELRSTTKEGFSQVVVQFVLEKNGNVGAQEVDAKVRTVLSQLPQGTDSPIIDKMAIDAAPVMTLAISGRRDFREITEIAKKRIKEDLETVNGVGSVVLVGGRTRAIQIVLDPDKLMKYENLTVEDIRQALLRENQENPGGRVDRGQSELVLRTMGRVDHPKDFTKLIVGNRNGQPIRLEDVGIVEDSYEEPRSISRLWLKSKQAESSPGDFAVSVVISKQAGFNTVAVVDTINKRLKELLPSLPPDITVEVIRDQSRFIRLSMEEVKVHLLLAVVLVSASILLFLRDWRTTIIATLAIPTSMVGAFAFMYAMGFTINNFTMIGLILAVGIVVDDAVVVHENIFRHMEEYGRSAWEAARTATAEIAMAVVATTMSLVVVFAPIAFMGGQVGRFFSCFGYVVGFSVLLSMGISFTMTPMLCARFLKLEPGHGASSKSGWIWKLIENSYIGMLGWSLRHRWVLIVLALGLLLSTPMLMSMIGFDFVPKDDQSEFEVVVTMPEGYTLDRADAILNEIDGRIRRLPGVTHSFIVIGDTTGRVTKAQGDVTRGSIYYRMVPLEERDYTQASVMKQARFVLEEYPDLRAGVQDVAAISASGFRQVEIDLNILGPDMLKLQAFSDQVAAWMKKQKVYVDVDTSISLRKPELRIRPDRERLSDLGVSLQDVSNTTNILVGGTPVSKYKEQDEQYDVWLRAQRDARDDQQRIAQMAVPAKLAPGGVTQLGNVVRFENAMGPNTIDRFSRQRQVVVSANLQGTDLSKAISELSKFLDEMNLPTEYRYEFIGRAKMLKESNANFLTGFVLAFIFIDRKSVV